MKKRSFKNDELNRIGRKLLDAGKTRREDIERIVSSPMLFEAIKERIEIERRERNSQGVFGGWTSILILNRQRATTATLLIFAAAAIGIMGFNRFIARQQFDQAAALEILPEIERIENPLVLPSDRFLEDSPSITKVKDSAAGKSLKSIKQNAFAHKTADAQKPPPRRKLQPEREKQTGRFYALTSSGNPAENGEPLQIVRAELSRSSLFALGVNVSIENDSQTIKTDLLVGADGVARAIRFVN